MMYVTFLAAFFLSSVSAYYSITGLTTIFMGAFWPIVIMGVALEFAKLVTASWLYQNWHRTSLLLRTYLVTAVIILVMITSMGIFGFLAKSHIDSTMDNKSNATELQTLDAETKILTSRLDYLLARAQTLSRSDNNEIASNRVEREIKDTQTQLSKLNQVKSSLLKNENELVAHIGPLFYLAQLFYNDPEGSVDKSVRLVILVIMFVFDPLAILLVIAGNMLAADKRKKDHPEEFLQTATTPAANNAQPPSNPMQTSATAEVVKAADAPASNPTAQTPSTPLVEPLNPADAGAPIAPPTPTAPQPAVSSGPSLAQLEEMKRQMASKLMTENDVIAAIKLFYDRAPSSPEEVAQYKDMSSKQILEIFYTSPEFLSRSGAATLVLGAAKKMQDLKNKA